MDQKVASVYNVKGSVANYKALEKITIKKIGDVYNVLNTGANYVWTEEGWDKLSETIDLSAYVKKEELENNYTNKDEFEKLVARVMLLETKEE